MNNEWTYAGYIETDTGAVVIGDPCYTLGFRASNDLRPSVELTWDDFVNKLASNVVEFNFDSGVPGLAVCVNSKNGDGQYGVYINKDPKNGAVRAVMVDFDGVVNDNKNLEGVSGKDPLG